MTKRALIYARVSTDEQAKGYSLQTQVDADRQYAASKGYTVLAEFTDDYTGASMDRPGLDQLRQYVAHHSVDVIIVYDVDRLARRSIYQMLLEEEFSRHQIKFEFVLGQYEDTDEGRLQKQIRASIAEYEKAKILERNKRGKRGKAKSGYVITAARPPYGYRVRSEPHKAWLEIEEAEAKIVQTVYQWYVHGLEDHKPLSMNAISVRLTRMGIPTRGDHQKHFAKKRGYGVWADAMVKHILTNETYTGVWHYGKTHIVDDSKTASQPAKDKRGLGKQVARDRADWIPVNVPPIISPELFEQAQARKRLNAEQSPRNTKRHYLLARRLRCAKCGYTYVGRTRREKHQYYICNGHQQVPVPVCDMPSFYVSEVDAVVWDWLKETLQQPENITLGLRQNEAEIAKANQSLYERVELIEASQKKTQDQLARLLDLYLRGDFPQALLKERQRQIEKEISDLETERAALLTQLQTNTLTDEEINDLEAYCLSIRDGLEYAPFEEKRHYLELFDVRGKLALENDEKVIYIQCKFLKQPQSVALTSPF